MFYLLFLVKQQQFSFTCKKENIAEKPMNQNKQAKNDKKDFETMLTS